MNDIKNIFVPYEESLKLQEIGFDYQCIAYFNDERILKPIETDYVNFRDTGDYVCSPTYEQAFDWFRERGFDLEIMVGWNNGKRIYECDWWNRALDKTVKLSLADEFSGSYEYDYSKARLIGLNVLIDNYFKKPLTPKTNERI